MRLVVQRVSSASVHVGEKVVGKIENGFMVLVGVKQGDTKNEAEKLAEKLSKLRIMADEDGKMNKSVKEVNAKVLAVSQFTLYADTSKGNRPSFIKAAQPKLASEIYDHFVSTLRKMDVEVETGKFGAYMDIHAKLEGPVTIIL